HSLQLPNDLPQQGAKDGTAGVPLLHQAQHLAEEAAVGDQPTVRRVAQGYEEGLQGRSQVGELLAARDQVGDLTNVAPTAAARVEDDRQHRLEDEVAVRGMLLAPLPQLAAVDGNGVF